MGMTTAFLPIHTVIEQRCMGSSHLSILFSAIFWRPVLNNEFLLLSPSGRLSGLGVPLQLLHDSVLFVF